MSTSTDIPTLLIGSFEIKEDRVRLRAQTDDGVQVEFYVDAMALAIMSLTMDGALRFSLDQAKARGYEPPVPPVAPESPEDLG